MGGPGLHPHREQEERAHRAESQAEHQEGDDHGHPLGIRLAFPDPPRDCLEPGWQADEVQTFLPYADFERSARALDTRRLGKQRVECLQVLRGLTIPTYGWRHHPAVKMWRGHEEALGRYALTCCEVWTELGFGDTCAATIGAELGAAGVTVVRTQRQLAEVGALPRWLGDEDFHRSHQSSLVRKHPDHYRPLFPDVPDDLPYVWPLPE